MSGNLLLKTQTSLTTPASGYINVAGKTDGYLYFKDSTGSERVLQNWGTGTLTADNPLSISQTWNNAAVTFNALTIAVTDTASNASSKLLSATVGGSTKFSVDKSGAAVFSGAVSGITTLTTAGDIYTGAQWQDYSASSTIVGWSSFTKKIIQYKQVGKIVFVSFYLEGTSNSTSVSFTLPFTSAAAPDNQGGVYFATQDNSLGLTTAGRFYMSAGTSTVNCNKDMGAGAWTASGTKGVQGNFWFQTA